MEFSLKHFLIGVGMIVVTVIANIVPIFLLYFLPGILPYLASVGVGDPIGFVLLIWNGPLFIPSLFLFWAGGSIIGQELNL